MVTGGGKGKIYVTHINIRQSIFFLVLKLFFLDVMSVIVAIFYFSSVSSKFIPEIFSNTILSYNSLFFLVLVLLKIALTIYVVMRWITEYYEIWPNLITHDSGFFLRKVERHPFAQMRSVKVEQGFFGKIFGFGTIYLYNWYLKTNTSLYLIHNPMKYFHIIENLLPKSEKEKEIFLDEPDAEES
jgi:hypothetical protein